jgi:hypothetical protein
MRSHLIGFLVIGDFVQVLEQPLQEIKVRGRKLAEEAPDVCQARLKTFNFWKTT